MKSLESSLLPAPLLRLEAYMELALIFVVYAYIAAAHWVFFAALFLAPDLSLLAYAKGPTRFAYIAYNLLHTSALPLALGLVAWHQQWNVGIRISLIWLAHIAFDRALGYGLKYPMEFKRTHLQIVAAGL
jgi:hypothetical protein